MWWQQCEVIKTKIKMIMGIGYVSPFQGTQPNNVPTWTQCYVTYDHGFDLIHQEIRFLKTV